MNTTQLIKPVRQVIELLTARKYSQLESLTKAVRLNAHEMAQSIAAYKRALVLPPDSAYQLMDVVEIHDSQPPRWSVTMPLWTEEEGRSDLSIELTLIKQPDGIKIELDDIHVL